MEQADLKQDVILVDPAGEEYKVVAIKTDGFQADWKYTLQKDSYKYKPTSFSTIRKLFDIKGEIKKEKKKKNANN